MHLALGVLLILVTFFSACSTISKNQSAYILKLLPPPINVDANQSPKQTEASLLPYLASDKEPALRWWARYELGRVWAKSNPEKSCQNFLQVSKEPGSPLAHLALLRSLEVCPATIQIDTVQSVEQIKEPWLQSEAITAAHLRAVQLKNEADELFFTPKMVSQANLQSQKISLLKRGIEIAKHLNQADKAVDLEKQLYMVAPRLNPEPKEEDYQKVAADYKQSREFAKAREYFDKIISNPNSNDLEKYKALDGIRMTYKLEERTTEYLRATSNVAKFAEFRFNKKSTKRDWTQKYHDAEIQFARAVWTKRSAIQAKKIVLSTQKNLGSDFPLTESNWLLARMAEEAGKYDETIALLEKIDLSQTHDSDLKQKILWYKAWNLRRSPRWQEAIESMKTLAADTASSPAVQSRDRYWLARTLKEHEQTDEAKKNFEWLVNEDPLGYYGILASRELELPFHALPANDMNDESQFINSKAFTNANDAVYFEWLAKTGEHTVAQQFLDFLFSAYQNEAFSKKASLVDFLRMYARVGGYKSLFARINDLSPEIRNEMVKEHPALLFPMPWKKEVAESASQFHVEPELVYSIMRQESSFDPHARSGADAFGLLQLIPKAAKFAKLRAPNIKYDEPEDLYDPEVNIPLGAAFIAETMKHYKGQLILTAAAYNASEEAIKGWLKTRLRNDPTEFIEDIPYEETRTYVKLVLRNYLFYKRLNLREPSMSFPEACLQGLQAANP